MALRRDVGGAFARRRLLESHKGDYGRVLVVAGCRRYSGAAYLTSQAALRTGSGLVTLAVPEPIYGILAVKLTEVIVVPAPATSAGSLDMAAVTLVRTLLSSADVLAIGPGLSTHARTGRMLRSLLLSARCPVVLDADGINLVAGHLSLMRRVSASWVLTPHPGEMARLLGVSPDTVQADRRRVAVDFAKRHGAVVVLKGYHTVVTDGRRVVVNSTGNPGMATGGSGDVLTGVIASLIGQGLPPFEAARWGVYLHGVAGDAAARELGESGLIASDILDKIPLAMQRVRRRSVVR